MARSTEGRVERLTFHAPASAEPAPVGASSVAEAASLTPALRPSDVPAVRDIVRDATARRAGVRVVGRGTWLDAGRPVRGAQAVALDGLTGIVDYTPGDLTLTARAGTSLAEIATATAAHGQWLALTPWGGDAGSLGATAATATAGPTSGSLGMPRDIVIGLEAVTGAGEVIRGGGRVVKNVAGFDLTRLMIGAWGTLGILTEVSVRLRALPERDTTVAVVAPNVAAALADLLGRLRAAPVAPLALEIVSASLARQLELGTDALILAHLAGNAEAVASQHDALASLGDVAEINANVWSALRTSEPAVASVVRLSSPTGRFAETWAAADTLATLSGGFAHASVLRAVARVIIPHVSGTLPAPAVDALQATTRDTRVFERLPAPIWSLLSPSVVSDPLSRGVRAAFDPNQVLNPGILGEDTA